MSFPCNLDYSNFHLKNSVVCVILPTNTDRILSFVSLIKLVSSSTDNKYWKLGVCCLVLFKDLYSLDFNIKENPLCW